MSAKPAAPKQSTTRWAPLRELATFLTFIVASSLLETLIVLYAMSLGLQDTSAVSWSFQFPGTSSLTTITVSPLFTLVPACVVVALAFSWLYLTKKLGIRRQEIRKGRLEFSSGKQVRKTGFLSKIGRAASNFSKRVRSRFSALGRLSQRVRLGRPTIKGAVIVLLTFVALILMFSLFAYPKLIYQDASNLYRTDLGLRGFVISTNNWAEGVVQALGPIGGIFKSASNALRSASPGFRDFAVGVGGIISPLASLDGAGKYLFFQNAAVWILVITTLLYGERVGKSYKYKK